MVCPLFRPFRALAKGISIINKFRFACSLYWTWRIVAVVILIFLLLSCYMPLPGYLARVGAALIEHGFSSNTLERIYSHSRWLKRYFTGPPSDREMVAFLESNREALERIAVLEIMGLCRDDENLIDNGFQPKGECGALLNKLDLWVGPTSTSFHNSIYNIQGGQRVGNATGGARISRKIEPQDWISAKGNQIKYWQKAYVYVPPLIKTNFASNDLLKLFEANNLILDSLDTPPKRIEANPYLHDCAVRQVDKNWYLELCAVPKN